MSISGFRWLLRLESCRAGSPSNEARLMPSPCGWASVRIEVRAYEEGIDVGVRILEADS